MKTREALTACCGNPEVSWQTIDLRPYQREWLFMIFGSAEGYRKLIG